MSAKVLRKPAVTAGIGRGAVPDSLPARLFLIAYDPSTGRLAARSRLGHLLRAAALIDLQLSGHLIEEDGRAHPARDTRTARGDAHRRSSTSAAAGGREVGNPVLGRVLADISGSAPRKWGYWVGRHHRSIVREVREELERGRLIKVEHSRRFGLFPVQRITLRHPLVRRQLLLAATDTLRPSRLVARVDLRDAALVVLASAGDVRPVLSKEQRSRHKDRLAQLTVRVGPVVPALRKTLQQASSVAAGGGG